MQQIYNIFDKKIGSNKISACLAVCGYTEFEHFKSFNSESISNMERYIGTICGIMKKEERKKYIDDIFLDNPSAFIFNPRYTEEILKIATYIKNHLENTSSTEDYSDKCKIPQPALTEHSVINTINISDSEDTENQETVFTTQKRVNFVSQDYKFYPKSEKLECSTDQPIFQENVIKSQLTPSSQSFTKLSSLNDYESDCDSEINEEEKARIEQFYVAISEKAKKQFKDCHLRPKINFDIMFFDVTDSLYNSKAFFICKICQVNNNSGLMIRFDLSDNGNVIFKSIKNHLVKHFQLSKDTSLTSINDNSLKSVKDAAKSIVVKGKPGRKPGQIVIRKRRGRKPNSHKMKTQ